MLNLNLKPTKDDIYDIVKESLSDRRDYHENLTRVTNRGPLQDQYLIENAVVMLSSLLMLVASLCHYVDCGRRKNICRHLQNLELLSDVVAATVVNLSSILFYKTMLSKLTK